VGTVGNWIAAVAAFAVAWWYFKKKCACATTVTTIGGAAPAPSGTPYLVVPGMIAPTDLQPPIVYRPASSPASAPAATSLVPQVMIPRVQTCEDVGGVTLSDGSCCRPDLGCVPPGLSPPSAAPAAIAAWNTWGIAARTSLTGLTPATLPPTVPAPCVPFQNGFLNTDCVSSIVPGQCPAGTYLSAQGFCATAIG
jgi:hypothetical protein